MSGEYNTLCIWSREFSHDLNSDSFLAPSPNFKNFPCIIFDISPEITSLLNLETVLEYTIMSLPPILSS